MPQLKGLLQHKPVRGPGDTIGKSDPETTDWLLDSCHCSSCFPPLSSVLLLLLILIHYKWRTAQMPGWNVRSFTSLVRNRKGNEQGCRRLLVCLIFSFTRGEVTRHIHARKEQKQILRQWLYSTNPLLWREEKLHRYAIISAMK